MRVLPLKLVAMQDFLVPVGVAEIVEAVAARRAGAQIPARVRLPVLSEATREGELLFVLATGTGAALYGGAPGW